MVAALRAPTKQRLPRARLGSRFLRPATAAFTPLSTFWVSSTGASPLPSLAYSATWDRDQFAGTDPNASLRLPLASARALTAQRAVAPSAGTVPGTDVLVVQAVSAPLAAQTISGSFDAVFKVSENAAALDGCAQIVLRVVSGDGATVRGTLYTGQSVGSVVDEWPLVASIGTAPYSTYTAFRFPAGASGATALSSVAAQDGDRLVVELGYRHFDTASDFGRLVVGDDAGAELAVGSTATANGWVGFDTALVPAGPVWRVGAGYDSAGASVTSFDVTVPGSVATGDVGLILVNWVGTTGETAPTCTATGWTQTVAPRTDGNEGWCLLSRVRQAGDSNTVTVSLGNTRIVMAAGGWWANSGGLGTVGAIGTRGASQSTTTAPSITTGGVERRIVAVFAERTIAAGTTATLDRGNARVYVEGSGGTDTSGLLADLQVAGTTSGAVTATYSGTGNTNGGSVLVELLPASTGPTPATVAATAAVPSATVSAGALATPATVAAVAVVPTATVQLGVLVTPFAVAATGSVPAPTVAAAATATPATVAATAAVPAPTVRLSVVITPSTVAAAAAVGAPTVSAGGSAAVTPSTVAAVAAVGAATVSAGATATPSTIAAVASVVAPTVRLSVALSPATVAATASVAVPTVLAGGDVAVSPATVAATAAVPAASVSTGSTATPSTVAATVAVPAATVRLGVIIAPTTVAATAAVSAPTVRLGVLVTPATVPATATIPAPTVTGGIVATPATVAAVAAIGAPALSVGLRITAVTVAATAAVPAATAQVSALAAPAVVAAVAAVPAASVRVGSTASPSTVPAAAGVGVPTVIIQNAFTVGVLAAAQASSTLAASSAPMTTLTAAMASGGPT